MPGRLSDISHFYSIAGLVCNLSRKPEPFGSSTVKQREEVVDFEDDDIVAEV